MQNVDPITVITVSRGRPALLCRAIASVREQDYGGHITHLVLVDDCAETASALAGVAGIPDRSLVVRTEGRGTRERSGRVRLSWLRNRGVDLAESAWIAFLDDDNEYAPDHLSSLMSCARTTGHSAVHSSRLLYHADGRPYLEERFPWVRDPDEGIRVFASLCAAGVLIRGLNVMHDRAGKKDDPNGIRMVDTSVWLLARALLLRFRFSCEYTDSDIRNNIYEDDKLLDLLVSHDIPIVSTGMPTLKYYLGGYSNTFSLSEL